MRNSLLLAPMPTASTAQILGNNEAIEPYTSNVYSRRVLSGEFQVGCAHSVISEHCVLLIALNMCLQSLANCSSSSWQFMFSWNLSVSHCITSCNACIYPRVKETALNNTNLHLKKDSHKPLFVYQYITYECWPAAKALWWRHFLAMVALPLSLFHVCASIAVSCAASCPNPTLMSAVVALSGFADCEPALVEGPRRERSLVRGHQAEADCTQWLSSGWYLVFSLLSFY